MPLQSGLLNNNFKTLYCALKDSQPHQLNLVANLSGTRIYDSTKLLGRFWCSIVCSQNLRLKKLCQALVHTHNLFQKQLPLVQTHLHNYQQYLKQLGQGYAVNEHKIHADRHAITTWNLSTTKFLKFINKSDHPKMQRLLHIAFPQNPSPFSTAAIHHTKIYSNIISLEGITVSATPLNLIKKIFKNKPLTPSELKGLKKWSEKLDAHPAHLSTIHKGISAITTFFNQAHGHQETSAYSPATLETFLRNHGSSLFDQSDPKQLSWRSQWKPGASIAHPEGSVLIGKLFGNHIPHSHHHILFELSSDPEHLALIPHNRVQLSLTQFQPPNAILPHAHIAQIMDGGRWALIEHLTHLNLKPWTSDAFPLSQEDLPKAEAIASLLKKCIIHNATPSHLSSDHVFLDRCGELKSAVPTKLHAFDFNALETFAFRASAGNKSVFRHIMQASGLSTHPTAKFYAAIAAATLKKESIHFDNLAAVYHISDGKVVERAKAFSLELENLHTMTLTALLEKEPFSDHALQTKNTAQILIQKYKQSGAGSIIKKNLE